MKPPHALDRRTPRPPGPRRASVLILVVALLVLIALVGTAFIVTARTDRGAARQHVHNTAADMALQSAVNLVLTELADDLFSEVSHPSFQYKKYYRPGSRDGGGSGYPFENADYIGDSVVAPRTPVLLNPNPAAPVTSLYASVPAAKIDPDDPAAPNPPLWIGVSARPGGTVYLGNLPSPFGGVLGLAPTARPYFGQSLWPCLQIYSPNPYDFDTSTPEIDPTPAADADGDGIADAMLWRLPLASSGNVTYLAGIRVIDNNAAINVNTALSRNFDFDGTGAARVEPIYLQGRVGLAELLRTYKPAGRTLSALGTEMARLNAYRFNGANPRQLAGVWDGAAEGISASAAFLRPVADDGTERGDFLFLSMCDVLQRQLGSRLGNPGYAAPGRSFRPLSLSDQMALAHRFCIASPVASPTDLERLLSESVSKTAEGAAGRPATVPDKPYSPDDVSRWFERFRYDAEVPDQPQTFRDRRALLVTRNPLANQAPGVLEDNDTNRDSVRNDLPQEAIDAGMTPYVPRPGVARAPTRVSINTAPFGDLWRGFWAVMAGEVSRQNPFAHMTPANSSNAKWYDPFRGSKFNFTGAPATDFTPLAFSTEGAFHWSLMFRSVIRDVRTSEYTGATSSTAHRFEVESMVLLRSALAAVNAEDLRDADDDVTTHLITLTMNKGGLPERTAVRVCGTERQPYLTEVYANTDNVTTLRLKDGTAVGPNPKGYVAIEIHNPYDEPINLGGVGRNGWSVGVIDRWIPSTAAAPSPAASPAKPLLWVRNLDGTPRKASDNAPPWRFPPGTAVPPHGFLVMENYDPDAPADLPAVDPRARFRPAAAANAALPATGKSTSATCNTVYVPDLHRLLGDNLKATDDTLVPGGEFVLLRTRRADGVSTDNSGGQLDPKDPYNEEANLWDLVPVDQFDFTGITQQSTAYPRFVGVHYARANDPAASPSGAWKFVYPGRYDGARRGGINAASGKPDPRHQGLVQISITPGDPTAAADSPAALPSAESYDPPPALGLPDARAHRNQGSFPIQMANFGHVRGLKAKGNMYPFGMFAREGDILQVTFIGACTVFKVSGGAGVPTRNLYEMNSVSMDSVFAEDSDYRDDYVDDPANPASTNRIEQREQIGRFCPVYFPPLIPAADRSAAAPDINDYAGLNNSNPSRPPFASFPSSGWNGPQSESPQRPGARYAWAADLLSYLTVEAPHNDFFPNVAPSLYKLPVRTPVRSVDVPIGKSPPAAVANYGGEPGNADPDDAVDPATKKPRSDNDFSEDLTPIEGRININTAPWPVLAALPMVLNPDGTVDVEANAELAKAIVYFRDIKGAYELNNRPQGFFRSVSDLNQVIDRRPDFMRPPQFRSPAKLLGFANGYGTLLPGAAPDPGVAAGDLSPFTAGATDGVRNDFEERNLVLTRISNLITTRSDSYTCYVYVVGVENLGTPQATIKTQRRAAFIADRSSIGPPPQRPVVHTQFFNND